eukprot:6190430-Pleurochrysis_carterae.AAC.4
MTLYACGVTLDATRKPATNSRRYVGSRCSLGRSVQFSGTSQMQFAVMAMFEEAIAMEVAVVPVVVAVKVEAVAVVMNVESVPRASGRHATSFMAVTAVHLAKG